MLLVQILALSIGIRALAERFVHNSMKIWRNSKKFEDFSSKWVFTFLFRFVDFCCSICVFDCVFVFQLCFLINSHHSTSISITILSFQVWNFFMFYFEKHDEHKWVLNLLLFFGLDFDCKVFLHVHKHDLHQNISKNHI